MAEQSIDVLMRIVGAAGPFAAESLTTFAVSIGSDTLRDGFVPGKFCELREFSYSAGIKASPKEDEEEKKKNAAKPGGASPPPFGLAGRNDRLRAAPPPRPAERSAADDTVDMRPVDFTRTMDTASTLLFKAMVECETLPELSIVKRKAVGSANSGDCYLRLDFEKVLITKLEWKDSEHIMMETGTFIYRKVTIRYRPQKNDGTLGTVVQSTWTMARP